MMNSELDLNIDGKYYNNLDVVGFSQMLTISLNNSLSLCKYIV